MASAATEAECRDTRHLLIAGRDAGFAEPGARCLGLPTEKCDHPHEESNSIEFYVPHTTLNRRLEVQTINVRRRVKPGQAT